LLERYGFVLPPRGSLELAGDYALNETRGVCRGKFCSFAGLPIAYWVTFFAWRWKFLIEAVVALPLVLPPTVLGYYILVGLGPRTFPGKLLAIVVRPHAPVHVRGLLVASVLYSLPFAVQPFFRRI